MPEAPALPLRLAADTGGTFTDLVVEGGEEGLRFFKRPTTPEDPVIGLLDVLDAAATSLGTTREELLGCSDLFVFGTTRATNAVVTGTTARTALLTTRGHPDILLFREGGGRTSLFDYSQEYPPPYVPRRLTFEIGERVGADGTVVHPLDEDDVLGVLEELRAQGVEAVAVSLLWSVVNPAHEQRLGELLEEHLPGVPYTLSHRLNPSLREYRRTSSAAIDASLKPLMSRFLDGLDRRLRDAGFGGRLLILTSAGGTLDAHAVAASPIHSIGSGPAAAPVAGRHFARRDAASDYAIVTDAGGTTYDVSLIRHGKIPWTRETIVGHPTFGYITGFPSVDVRSIGAGGGSIASVDAGGLLHVGPGSAGAEPGPAAYGRGGTRPTVTDACVALGYIDPDYFLGGEMKLDRALAEQAIATEVAEPLGMSVPEVSLAILRLAVEHMVRAIEEITLNQGIDPAGAVMVGGGGGAGLYSVGIARRLGARRVVIPEVSAALSAAGAVLSELRADYSLTEVMSSATFDHPRANRALATLRASCEEFRAGPGAAAVRSHVDLAVEARYPHQVWEIEVPLAVEEFRSPSDVERVVEDFHAAHEEIFAVSDPASAVEFVGWRAHVRCGLREPHLGAGARVVASKGGRRRAYFADVGLVDAEVRRLESLVPGEPVEGPALVESSTTTVVVEPGSSVERLLSGSLLLNPRHGGDVAREPASTRARLAPAVEGGGA